MIFFYSVYIFFMIFFFKFTIARLPLESQQSIVEFKKVGLTKYRIANIKEKGEKKSPKRYGRQSPRVPEAAVQIDAKENGSCHCLP